MTKNGNSLKNSKSSKELTKEVIDGDTSSNKDMFLMKRRTFVKMIGVTALGLGRLDYNIVGQKTNINGGVVYGQGIYGQGIYRGSSK